MIIKDLNASEREAEIIKYTVEESMYANFSIFETH